MRHLPPWKIACHLSLQSFTANNVLKGFFYWLGNQLGFISAFFKALHWFASTFVQQYHENAKGVVGFSCSLHFRLGCWWCKFRRKKAAIIHDLRWHTNVVVQKIFENKMATFMTWKASVLQKLAKSTFLAFLNELLSTQNIIVARFAY